MRKVIKRRKRGVCPRCGRTGEYREFDDGTIDVVHAFKMITLEGLGTGREITDWCRTKR